MPSSELYKPANQDLMFFAYDDFRLEGLKQFETDGNTDVSAEMAQAIAERYGLDEHSLAAARAIGENQAKAEKGLVSLMSQMEDYCA